MSAIKRSNQEDYVARAETRNILDNLDMHGFWIQ